MKNGKLNIIGIGPGSDDQITPAALAAIREADSVIGYSTYINLVKHHLGGKQVTFTGMSEEITRARTAVQMAKDGQIVALISSGDAGVYGMAGLVFEVLRDTGWKRGDSPDIRMVPGVTADSSCASLVGAPLVHDAARISLSDLLTPWSVIENRIESAAAGDFVINLYNPASGRRQRQIVEAARIIKKHRPGTTPVALVKSAYRHQQTVVISDLDHFLDFEIGMNTTVIIGSTSTFVYEGFMVTPRGYTNKYQLDDGALKEGQMRAVSLKYDGDLASRFSKSDKAPGLNITKISNVFSRAKTAVFAGDASDVVTAGPDPSVASALGALQILENIRDTATVAEKTGTDKMATAFLGRIGGAMVLKYQEKYYLVGKQKEPVDFSEFGFNEPSEYDRVTMLGVNRPEKLQNIPFTMITSVSGNDPANEVYDRFAIYRNSAISERIITYVTNESQREVIDGISYTDAEWLGKTPLPVWNIVRENLLKC